jgi:ferredoxin
MQSRDAWRGWHGYGFVSGESATRRKTMADKNDKIPENVPGKYYVDKTCVPCHTCMEVEGAGALLKYNDDQTYVYFHAQPTDEAQVKIAEDSLAICPTGAIGNDGE